MEYTAVDGGEFLSEDLLEATESSQLCMLQDDCAIEGNC
jgi:hypothetical protein